MEACQWKTKESDKLFAEKGAFARKQHFGFLFGLNFVQHIFLPLIYGLAFGDSQQFGKCLNHGSILR